MKQNVGILDTAVRSIIACVLLALAVENMFSPAVKHCFRCGRLRIMGFQLFRCVHVIQSPWNRHLS